MKKTILLTGFTVFLLLGIAYADHGHDDDGRDKSSVILIYRTRVNAYRHEKVGDAWTYNGDRAKRNMYHVLEFDPTSRSFKKQARRIVYYDQIQKQEKGMYFNEYQKEPKDGERYPYMHYVVGSCFDTKGKKSGVGEVLYGNIVLSNPVNIGWERSIPIAKTLKGKINAEGPDFWNNFVLNSRLDTEYTKLANSNNYSVEKMLKIISEDLEKKGYRNDN